MEAKALGTSHWKNYLNNPCVDIYFFLGQVILSILFPPAILMLEFKTKAEMSHIPQTEDAHQMNMEDSEHNFQSPTDQISMVR